VTKTLEPDIPTAARIQYAKNTVRANCSVCCENKVIVITLKEEYEKENFRFLHYKIQGYLLMIIFSILLLQILLKRKKNTQKQI